MRHWLSLLIALSCGSGLSCAGRAPSAVSAPAPASLPATLVTTVDGTPTDLAAFVRGRPALISLWATWCDACLGEIDALNRLDAAVAGRGAALVVGVAVGEGRGTVAAFARRRRVAYATLVDEDFRLADALGERRVPATLVVDRSGRIVYRGGALDEGGLTALRGALGEGNGP